MKGALLTFCKSSVKLLHLACTKVNPRKTLIDFLPSFRWLSHQLVKQDP